MKKKQLPFLLELIVRVFKKARLSTLLLLILLFASNSFAWFIYSTRVQNNISAHVRAWSVAFEIGNDPAINYINIDITDVYPGMTNYVREIKASNHGDSPATLTYEILSARIFGQTYEAGHGYTSASLANKLANDYPFKINVTLSTNVIAVGDHNQKYTISVTWPYESGNDDLDTYWGVTAYDFHQNYPTQSSIFLQIKIVATQVENTPATPVTPDPEP